MSISSQFLDEIRNRLTLSEVIGRRIKVTRAGRESKACCPFHHEKTPSFTINDDKQFYHCFGCGAHGDVLKFVMEHDNLPFREAVEMLAGEAGLQVPKDDPRAAEKAQRTKSLYDLMELVVKWYEIQLRSPDNVAIQNYLKDRGLTGEMAKKFNLGYAPSDVSSLREGIKQEGYKDTDLVELGVLKKSQKTNDYYPFFRDRVMFPVSDRRGRFIALGGRILPDGLRPPDRGDFTPPKYLNSPDTPLFDKGRVLYAEDKAKIAARDEQTIIVAEGYMDVIACHQAGFNGAIAPMGTALTEQQVESLWTMIPDDIKEPVLCFDGDRAGQQAASRASDRILPLLKPGRSVRFAFMPEGEDPDSYIAAYGSQKFQALLDNAVPLIDYIWRQTVGGRPSQTPEQRASIVTSLRKKVDDIADTEVKRHYKAQIDKRINDTFFDGYNKKNTSGYNNNYKGSKFKGAGVKPALKPVSPKVGGYDKVLLAALINHPYIFDRVEEHVSKLKFPANNIQKMKEHVVLYLSDNHDANREMLVNDLAAQGYAKEMRDILDEKLYIHAAFAAPVHDSDVIDHDNTLTNWLEIWEAMQTREAQRQASIEWKKKI